MAFKMRNSLIQGSRLHKEHKLKVQREGYANMEDGRANSSAFQQGTVVKDNKMGVDYSAMAKVDVPDTDMPSTRFKQEGESGPMTQTVKGTGPTTPKHPIYGKLSAEEKKEYDSLTTEEKNNIDWNKDLIQLKQALAPDVDMSQGEPPVKKKTINSNTSFKMNTSTGDDELKEALNKSGAEGAEDNTGKDVALLAALGPVGLGINEASKWKKRQIENAYKSSFEGSDYEAMEEL